MRPRVAVLDNYDSFTFNLAQYLAELGADPQVHRNDKITVEELAHHDLVVLSPGPCTPTEAGISVAAARELTGHLPVLGVCLGHQSIAAAFGADIIRTEPVHGSASLIEHDGDGVLRGLPTPFEATRYHSLSVDHATLPAELVPTAWTGDTLMGLQHREHPTFGVQFHPESILTPQGRRLLTTFLEYGDD